MYSRSLDRTIVLANVAGIEADVMSLVVWRVLASLGGMRDTGLDLWRDGLEVTT